MFCTKCGKEIDDEAYMCPNCGLLTQKSAPLKTAVKDSGSPAWALLGFMFPIIGLILLLLWKIERPESAKWVGIGSFIGLFLQVSFIAVYFTVIIGILIDIYKSSMLFTSTISILAAI